MSKEVNTQMSESYRRAEHEPWAKGFRLKSSGCVEYHPYTKKDFWINNPLN